ncbi:MAG: pseudouridine-5'-phosphate glycosidase [Actinomycetota bacterium]
MSQRVDGAAAAAAVLVASLAIAAPSPVLLCNPAPATAAMPEAEVAAATAAGVHGPAVTPFLLACLAQETGGRSLEANLALLEDNARVAGEIAVAFAATGGVSAARS